MCKQIRALRAYNQFVPMYKVLNFHWKSFVHTSYHLYFINPHRSRLTQFLTSEIDFLAKTQQLDFLKNQFVTRLRHFRSTSDLRIRAFDKAHATVRGTIFCSALFIYFIRIPVHKRYKFVPRTSRYASTRAFCA